MEVATHIRVHEAHPVWLIHVHMCVVYLCVHISLCMRVYGCVQWLFVCVYKHAHMDMLKPEVNAGCLPQLFSLLLFFSFSLFFVCVQESFEFY